MRDKLTALAAAFCSHRTLLSGAARSRKGRRTDSCFSEKVVRESTEWLAQVGLVTYMKSAVRISLCLFLTALLNWSGAICSGATGMPAIANDLDYVTRAGAASAAIVLIIRLRAITTRMRARLSCLVSHDLPPLKLISKSVAAF